MRAVLGVVVLVLLVGLPGPAHGAREEPVGVWPLAPEPEVVRGFEPPPGPWAAGHRGVDLAGHPGQTVRAALPGTVGFGAARLASGWEFAVLDSASARPHLLGRVTLPPAACWRA